MRLSTLSIERPVLATVMSLLILVAGATSWFLLPVREYPDVDVPVVSVRTPYPGASPRTVETTVTEPLEEVLNSIEEIRSVESTSAFGISTIEIEFLPGRDVDLAATDVSNAVQRALGELPDEAERPIVSKTGANTFPIMWLALSGEGWAPEDLSDLADRAVQRPLQILPGVARVLIGGERRYAMRIWLDPAAMAARRVAPDDVRRAVRESNLQLPAGEVEAHARKFVVDADAILDEPEAYADIVIREDGDAPVRIRDVGRVELGSADYDTVTRFDREPIVGLGIVRQSRANELAVSEAVRAALPRIRETLPEGVRLQVAVDETIFVEESLGEVWKTLGIAFALVIVVNLVFLRSGTTTSIASTAIPVSLVGTFGVMQAAGFSLNVLTLLALVLAIGLLVDDAIVVMENCYRRQERGEERVRAARNGATEVGFAVIATTLSVVAVLLPLSFLTGNTGRLFREFALSMAGAVSISTFVALTLVPMLCARYLEVGPPRRRISRWIEPALDGARRGYDRLLAMALAHGALVGLFVLGVLAGTVVLFQVLPRTFAPVEDRGRIVTIIRAPEGATTAFTDRALSQVEARFERIGPVQGFFSAIGLAVGGVPSSSRAVLFARMEPWNERKVKQQTIVDRLAGEFMAIPQALVFPINPPSLGQRTINDVQVVLQSATGDLDQLVDVTESVLARVREIPGLVNVDSDLRIENPELRVRFDRERAADLGVPVSAVSDALRLMVAEGEADEFVLRNQQYDVVIASAGPFRASPEALGEIHLPARDGAMVPLSALVDLVPAIGATTLNRFDLQRSATITASLAQGATLGATLPRVERIAAEESPAGFSTALAGISREYVESANQIFIAFGVALLVIYLTLSAQFESFLHPLTVMFSVPLATLGAMATLMVFGETLNVYSEIGIVLLIGLVTKNSILLVDFANQERARGRGLHDALRRAGDIRFRPILMTAVTSIFGAMPLALATGAGAESRRPIGLAVVGGLLFATVFTLVVIPVVHLGVIRAAERIGWSTVPPRVELEDEGESGRRPGG